MMGHRKRPKGWQIWANPHLQKAHRKFRRNEAALESLTQELEDFLLDRGDRWLPDDATEPASDGAERD